MISSSTALLMAPDHWLDWLRHRSVADTLRTLLTKLRQATPMHLRQDRKAQRLLHMIARAETDELAALLALATIENQYRRDKKSKRLRQAASLKDYPTLPHYDLAWSFDF